MFSQSDMRWLDDAFLFQGEDVRAGAVGLRSWQVVARIG